MEAYRFQTNQSQNEQPKKIELKYPGTLEELRFDLFNTIESVVCCEFSISNLSYAHAQIANTCIDKLLNYKNNDPVIKVINDVRNYYVDNSRLSERTLDFLLRPVLKQTILN